MLKGIEYAYIRSAASSTGCSLKAGSSLAAMLQYTVAHSTQALATAAANDLFCARRELRRRAKLWRTSQSLGYFYSCKSDHAF